VSYNYFPLYIIAINSTGRNSESLQKRAETDMPESPEDQQQAIGEEDSKTNNLEGRVTELEEAVKILEWKLEDATGSIRVMMSAIGKLQAIASGKVEVVQ
jgi:multidrug resistance efflux pump